MLEELEGRLAPTVTLTFPLPTAEENQPLIIEVGAIENSNPGAIPNFQVAFSPFAKAATIASATESGNIVTITTTAPHGFLKGQNVTIAGVGVAGYNGTFAILGVTANTFTYIDIPGLVGSGGGTAIAGKTITLVFASNSAGVVQFGFGAVPPLAEGQTFNAVLVAKDLSDGTTNPPVNFSLAIIENAADKPVLGPLSNQTVNPGQTLALTAIGVEADPSDKLLYSLTQGPEGASIDPSSGVFTWTPPAQVSGVFPVTVHVTIEDQPALFAEQPFSITVLGPAPLPGPVPVVGPGPVLAAPVVGPDPVLAAFDNNVLLTTLNPILPETPPLPGLSPVRGTFALGSDLSQTLFPVRFVPGSELTLVGASMPYNPAPDASPFAVPLELQLNLDRATPRPLRLSNTEGGGDSSSVERLYKDFLAPADPPRPPDQD